MARTQNGLSVRDLIAKVDLENTLNPYVDRLEFSVRESIIAHFASAGKGGDRRGSKG